MGEMENSKSAINMSFEMDRLLRYQPEPELTQREIKDLKDGVPNYPMPEFQGPEPSLEHLCCECTGSGVMIGNYPCKVCRGTGYVVPIADADITQGATQVALDILDQFEREKNRAFMDLVITGSTIIRKPPLEEIKNAWQKYTFSELKKKLANGIANFKHGVLKTDDPLLIDSLMTHPMNKAFQTYKNGEQDKGDYIKQMGLYQESITESWRKIHYHIDQEYKKRANAVYPNERELSLLNARIAKLKVQLSKELQKKKAERNQFEINQIQQSINTLTKWKLPSKNSTQTGC